ncbi:MAG: hypothetical protein LQ338_007455 [Usnochroma carphineum]|nr:MAG: hypothetical protein LQ338_007455 [Usnochroma carphineum]
MSTLPTRVYGGVAVPDTPLIKSALELARAHMKEPLYNHVVRAWLFGFIIADKVPALEGRDREAHSIAAILHDLGWSHSPELVTKDQRFEVDGANAARQFLKREAGDTFNKHRLQLVWDAIALHTTTSLAWYKEAEVIATSYGIRTDFTGVEGAPMGLLTQKEYDAVVKEVPRLGMKEAFKEVMCDLCRTKPETTYDNMCSEWGEKYVEGYSRAGHGAIDRIEPGLERLG